MAKRALKMAGLMSVITILMAVVGFAQNGNSSHPVEGSYSVEAKGSELGTVNFVIVLKRDGGKWVGEFKDSPMPLTVTSISVDESNKVTINADAGGTTVTIIGKFADGKIDGDWTAGDTKGTWTAAKKDAVVAAAASPAAKPVAAASVSSAAAAIEGTYDFKIVAEGQGEFPMTLVIKRDGEKLVTEVPGGGDLLITGIEIKEGDAVSLNASFQGNPFLLPGKRTGSEMGGKWEAGGFSGTWSAKKK